MSDRLAFEFEGPASPSEAADMLARLAEGIRVRALALAMGDRRIAVHPEGDLSLAVDAIEKKGRGAIEIAIAWRQPRDDGE